MTEGWGLEWRDRRVAKVGGAEEGEEALAPLRVARGHVARAMRHDDKAADAAEPHAAAALLRARPKQHMARRPPAPRARTAQPEQPSPKRACG